MILLITTSEFDAIYMAAYSNRLGFAWQEVLSQVLAWIGGVLVTIGVTLVSRKPDESAETDGVSAVGNMGAINDYTQSLPQM